VLGVASSLLLTDEINKFIASRTSILYEM